jgi:hypothetical protein
MGIKAADLFVGIMLFTIGTYGAFKIAVRAESAKDRPDLTAQVTTSAEGRTSLKVDVDARGLRVNEYVLLTVQGLVDRSGTSGAERENKCPIRGVCTILYSSEVGANQLGVVDKTIEIPLTNTSYRHAKVFARLCGPAQAASDKGCSPLDGGKPVGSHVGINLPVPQRTPSIALTWEEATTSGRIPGSVAVDLVGVGPQRGYLVQVLADTKGSSSLTDLATSRGTGSVTGKLSITVPIRVPVDSKSVCVIAEVGENTPPTPSRPRSCKSTGGSTLIVPVP